MQIAIIKNNRIDNVIEVEPLVIEDVYMSALDHARQLLPGADLVPLPEGAGIGWIYTDEATCLPPPEPEPTTAMPLPRRVSVGAFFDRFGTSKWGILADQSPTVQALVRDCSVRTFIDLDRIDLRAALALLVQAGHAIDADAILSNPVQPAEVP